MEPGDLDGLADQCFGSEPKETEHHDRVIVHIDMDCFYAQVDMILNPDLKDKPLGIQQKNLVVTCNYVARKLGVTKLMYVKDALEVCPSLVLINGEDLQRYRDYSRKVYELLQRFSPLVEKLGLDENYIDITAVVCSTGSTASSLVGNMYGSQEELCTCGCKERLVRGSAVARAMRDCIYAELGLTCCAGIAHNKLLAKIAGSTHKPNQQTTVFPSSALSLVSSLNTPRAIPGIGSSTSKKMDAAGIQTVTQLQMISLPELNNILGSSLAVHIKQLAFGKDDTPVKITDKPKSIGAEDGFKTVTSLSEIREKLVALLRRAWKLVEQDGRVPCHMKVTVRKYTPGSQDRSFRESRQISYDPSFLAKKAETLTDPQEERLISFAKGVFRKMIDTKKVFHVTLLGISFSGFSDMAGQPSSSSSITKYFTKKAEQDPGTKTTEHRDCVRPGEEASGSRENLSCSGSVTDSHVKRPRDNPVTDQIDESVLKELPQDIQDEIVASMSATKSLTSKTAPFHSDCPPGIDPEVYAELPEDIRRELKRSTSSQTATPPSPKKARNLFDYFPKK